MLAIGDVHIYVNDFEAALRFWAEGLQLDIAEQDTNEQSAFARMEFPDGGPSVILISSADGPGANREMDEDAQPQISFDIITDDFDATLVRLLEHDGQQVGEIEKYHELKLTTIADPEGNLFELIEVPAGEE